MSVDDANDARVGVEFPAKIADIGQQFGHEFARAALPAEGLRRRTGLGRVLMRDIDSYISQRARERERRIFIVLSLSPVLPSLPLVIFFHSLHTHTHTHTQQTHTYTERYRERLSVSLFALSLALFPYLRHYESSARDMGQALVDDFGREEGGEAREVRRIVFQAEEIAAHGLDRLR